MLALENKISTTLVFSQCFPSLIVQDLFLLYNLFHYEDAQRIMRLRPSITGSDDRLYWRYSKTGSYTVKSGYHLQSQIDSEQERLSDTAQSNQLSQVSSSSLIQSRNQLLQKLWRCNIPPKIKNFWWKLIHNSLPVADNLRRRGCKVPVDCQTCGENAESIIHMLVKCPVAREIWTLSHTDLSINLDEDLDLISFVQVLLQQNMGDTKNNLALLLGWRIWKMRNKLLFQNKREHITHTINAAIIDKKLWDEAMKLKEQPQLPSQPTLPNSTSDIIGEDTMLYCIADASWKTSNELAGIGWSLYSKEGTLLIQGSSAIDPTETALQAEAMAILLAVQQLHALHYKNVMFLGDWAQLFNNLDISLQRENKRNN